MPYARADNLKNRSLAPEHNWQSSPEPTHPQNCTYHANPESLAASLPMGGLSVKAAAKRAGKESQRAAGMGKTESQKEIL